MKLRLLDILACPSDKMWPLNYFIFEKRENQEVKLPPKDEKTGLVCGNYCGNFKVMLVDEKTNKKTEDCKTISYETNCRDCLTQEIVAGIIECPKCKTHYPIIDEIPIMLKAELRNEDIEKEFTEKWSDKIKKLLANRK